MKKILIVCSTSFYSKIEPIRQELEKKFKVLLPNSYLNTNIEKNYDDMTKKEYCDFFKEMFFESRKKVGEADMILVLNYDKNDKKNYIGASTFLEIYEAYMQEKKIYVLNELPNNLLIDELKGCNPIIINNDLLRIE